MNEKYRSQHFNILIFTMCEMYKRISDTINGRNACLYYVEFSFSSTSIDTVKAIDGKSHKGGGGVFHIFKRQCQMRHQTKVVQ